MVTGETASDHRIIRFDFNLKPVRFLSKPVRFAVSRANWDAFASAVPGIDLNADPHTLARSINDAVISAAVATIPRHRPTTRLKPPWWTPEVISAKRLFRSCSRSLDRSDPIALQSYKSARNRLNLALRMAKIASWRRYCTTEGSTPWGKLYQWLKRGSTSSNIHTTLKKPDGNYTNTMSDTVSVLLDVLIPHEPQIVNELDIPLPPYRFNAVTLVESRAALWGISPNKAPGADCVNAKLLRAAWHHISIPFVNLANACFELGGFPRLSQTCRRGRHS